MSTSATTEVKQPKAKKAKKEANESLFDVDSLDVIIPTLLLAEPTGGECSMLVQIDPQDAALLDFEGAQGAIGRFEAEDTGVTLDLKGYQYHGKIHAGPTALVLVVGKTGQLKVDAITDEFITVRKTQDVMAKLNAVVRGDMDAGYNVMEENVNETKDKKDQGDSEPVTKKRKISAKKKKS